jgi:hypothetical protein
LIDSGGREGFGLAGGPADFDRVDLGFSPEAEVEAQVVGGVIA